MIVLGLLPHQKEKEILSFLPDGAKKVFILSPKKFFFSLALDTPHEWIEWNDIIQYATFYRLLQEIDNQTVVVINECLRMQNRNDLTFNCIRHFLSQTKHQLVLQYLPVISTRDDFMTLFDFDTKSQWKREKFSAELICQAAVKIHPVELSLNAIYSEADSDTKAKYLKQKDALFDRIGTKDPHTIPRNLYLIGGKTRLNSLGENLRIIARNTRIKFPGLQTYKDTELTNAPYAIMEFPHDHINFSDFLYLAEQSEFDVAVSDLNVDLWYFERYQTWIREINYVYSVIRQSQDSADSGQRKNLILV